jgi:RimJ/RimL family protein N-acetyltransferase
MPADRPGSIEGMTPLVVAAGHVVLRPWAEDDLDALWSALQDPEIRLWNGSGSGSREEARELIERRNDWSDGTHASWAIAEPTGELLGSVSIHRIDPEHASAEIGYWTAPLARGRGAATAGVAAACAWAYDAVPLERIQILHAVENAGSARVAEKAGFTLEGRMRRSYRYADGVLHDELVWSRLRDDPAPSLGRG